MQKLFHFFFLLSLPSPQTHFLDLSSWEGKQLEEDGEVVKYDDNTKILFKLFQC